MKKEPRVIRLSAVIAVALAAGFVAWFLSSGRNDRPTTSTNPGLRGAAKGKPTTVPISAQGLRTLAGALKQPIYWVGRRPGSRLELTRESDGRVFIRYLPAGTRVGAKKPFVTIGTYPLENAYSLTQAVAAKSDSVRLKTNRGIAFYSKQSPTNVYLAYPSTDVQVEVYDPWALGARKLVESGAVVAVPPPGSNPGTSFRTAPQVLTLSALRSFARRVGHPVYWVGPRSRTRYEVTQTTNGRIFVRYLPTGTPAGIDRPYLTIGTYPVKDALGVTRESASGTDSARVPVVEGAVAFYARARPTNIYEAFHGVDYQVEIYDPSPWRGRALVKSNHVVPIT